jgi:hypothetical protein
MTVKRSQVYADEDMIRRVELAAARQRVPVTRYCLQAITQQLRDDDMLERAQVEISVAPADAALIADLKTLHARILARRAGKPIDIDQALEAVRDERDNELTGLY